MILSTQFPVRYVLAVVGTIFSYLTQNKKMKSTFSNVQIETVKDLQTITTQDHIDSRH